MPCSVLATIWLRLKALGTTVVSCPRSNRYVGVGDPPLEAFYAMGLSVALGTDSLASVDDLNMFEELAAARKLAPRVPARDLLESATSAARKRLGLATSSAALTRASVRRSLPCACRTTSDDVEEYLLSRRRARCDQLARRDRSVRPTPNAGPAGS